MADDSHQRIMRRLGGAERDYVKHHDDEILKKHMEKGNEAAVKGNIIQESIQDYLKQYEKKSFCTDPDCKDAYTENSKVLHNIVAVDTGVVDSDKIGEKLQKKD